MVSAEEKEPRAILRSSDPTAVPFDEPRSSIIARPGSPSQITLAWWPETTGRSTTRSLSDSRPIVSTALAAGDASDGQGMGVESPSVILSPAETRVDDVIRAPLT